MPNNKEKCCEGCLRIQPDGFHGCCDITCPCHRPAHSAEDANEEIIQEGLERLYGKVEEPQGEGVVTEYAERIVIEYANLSGRESEYRTFVREAALKVLPLLLSQTKREAVKNCVRHQEEAEVRAELRERQRILKIMEGMSKESDGEYMDIIWNQDPRSEYYNRALSDVASRLQEEPKHND